MPKAGKNLFEAGQDVHACLLAKPVFETLDGRCSRCQRSVYDDLATDMLDAVAPCPSRRWLDAHARRCAPKQNLARLALDWPSEALKTFDSPKLVKDPDGVICDEARDVIICPLERLKDFDTTRTYPQPQAGASCPRTNDSVGDSAAVELDLALDRCAASSVGSIRFHEL